MNLDPVTVIEELIYQVCDGDPDLAAMLPYDGPGAGIRVWPHPGPADAVAPYITHEIQADETSAMPVGGTPGMFRVPWWIAAWSDQLNRQSLRPVVMALQAALVGPHMKGRVLTFDSVDGRSYEVSVRRSGAIPAPAGVDEGQHYHRVMVGYVFEIQRVIVP